MFLARISLALIFVMGPPAQGDAPYQSALTAAVHHFAREGQLEHLRALLDKHPQLVDATETFPEVRKPTATEGFRPLDWAATRGHEEVAEYLIRRGARVNAVNANGWTPLLLAARDGHLGVVKLLVKQGADLAAKTEAIPESSSDSLPGSPARIEGKPAEPPKILPGIPSRTPLDWAVAMGHDKVADYLRSQRK